MRVDTCRVGSSGKKEGRRVPERGGQRQIGHGGRDRETRGGRERREAAGEDSQPARDPSREEQSQRRGEKGG